MFLCNRVFVHVWFLLTNSAVEVLNSDAGFWVIASFGEHECAAFLLIALRGRTLALLIAGNCSVEKEVTVICVIRAADVGQLPDGVASVVFTCTAVCVCSLSTA